ncbi:MAG: hypothetical protein ACE5QV_07200, partial [Fidelibacterota bacterium]
MIQTKLYPDHITHHQIEITLNPGSNSLAATDKIILDLPYPNPEKITLFLNKNLRLKSVKFKEKQLPFTIKEKFDPDTLVEKSDKRLKQKYNNTRLIQIDIQNLPPAETMTMEISYEGVIYDTLKTPSFSREYVAHQTTGLISEDGIYLSPDSHWYPDSPESMSSFKLTTWSPPEYEVVTQGRRIERAVIDDRLKTVWEADYPSDGLHLISGKYEITHIQYKGINLYTYFFPEESTLVSTYLEAAKRYMDMYGEMLGEYPYSKFAIVENFFPT